MKILATFDASPCGEAILPQLEEMAHMPGAEVTLLSVVKPPPATPQRAVDVQTLKAATGSTTAAVVIEGPAVEFAEDRTEAIARAVHERIDYLRTLALRLPATTRTQTVALVDPSPGSAIIRYAMQHRPDVIVMGTHGQSGIIHRVFGDVAEEVVRSGVAPVLLVQPDAARRRD